MKTGAPMESHEASVLTPFAFSKLQEQFVLAAHYESFHMNDGFLVRHHTKLEEGRKAYWVPQEDIISCSCHLFEVSGILCRHAPPGPLNRKLLSDSRKVFSHPLASDQHTLHKATSKFFKRACRAGSVTSQCGIISDCRICYVKGEARSCNRTSFLPFVLHKPATSFITRFER
ncbi:hypothetical protein Patl1_26874 [Pistacia atlantica]|uniref:Uncharacterized protein n=1 Tax=Pistacia atlantica TaxID=434234 RepID=A0ACC1B0C7_9ROSI|nr:hypothetical protein Patl1_26874 [Pistacia atlantica]